MPEKTPKKNIQLTATEKQIASLIAEINGQVPEQENAEIVVVGLSGTGKSFITDTLHSRIPISCFTPIGRAFREGEIQLPESTAERVVIILPGLTYEQSTEFIKTRIVKPSRVSIEDLNECTLGIPALLVSVQRNDTLLDITERTLIYLGRHISGLPQSQIPQALNTIEQHLLGKGRKIPLSILESLKRVSSEQPVEEHILEFMDRQPDPVQKAIYLYLIDAIRSSHPDTKSWYENPVTREIFMNNPILTIAAWANYDEFPEQNAKRVIQSPELLDHLGSLGELLKLFNLDPECPPIGAHAYSPLGGGAKESFVFRIGQTGQTEHERLEQTISKNIGLVDKVTSLGDHSPNFYYYTYGHPGDRAPLRYGQFVESVLQKLGVRYVVTRGSAKFEYIPPELGEAQGTFIDLAKVKKRL
jgi:hypothetical protein